MYLNSKNINIYYQTAGRGPDLVLLHGWKQDVSTWWGVVDLLKDDFKIWLIDLPGFGRSDSPKNPWTVSDYADAVADFIKKLKIKKPILLGHSVGGNVAIKLVSKYPNLISKLILEDSSGIRPQDNPFRFILYLLAKVFHYLVPNLFGIKDKIRYNFYHSLESDYLNAGDLKGTLVNILNENLVGELLKIKTETLILWGEKDHVVKLNYGKKLYRLIPNSRLEIIENADHFPHQENPNLFIYYVKDFSTV